MNKASVLVTGASGVLGWHLCRHLGLQDSWRVTGTVFRNRPGFDSAALVEMDLSQPGSMKRVIRSAAWDAIVHAGAMTVPDECERDRKRAHEVNVAATGRLLDLVPPECRFLYMSTDLVFDGESGGYRESDPPGPVNYYGETKLEAENLVRQRPSSTVVRIAKLYSHGSPFHSCFTNWVRDALVEGREVRLFTDQFRTPVSVWDVCRGLARILSHPAPAELYHLGGPDRLSRYDFGLAYADIFGLPSTSIRPVLMSDVGLVPRGRDCSLVSESFRRDCDLEPQSVRQGLRELRDLEGESGTGQ